MANGRDQQTEQGNPDQNLGTDAGQVQKNSDEGSQKSGDGDDKSGLSLDVSKSFWDTTSEDNQQNVDKDKTPQTIIVQNKQEPSEADRFQAHVDALDFGGLDLNEEQLQQFFDNRDLSGLKSQLQSNSKKVYSQVMLDVVKIIQTNKQQILEEAKSQMQQHTAVNEERAALITAIPSIAAPALLPVAESIMANAKAKGQNTKDAIETVKQFFVAMSTHTAKDIGLTTVPKDAPGSGGFNSNTDEPDPDINFVELLTAKP